MNSKEIYANNPTEIPGSPGTVAYELEGALYLNITRACTARCIFCYREEAPRVGPYNLTLTRDPTIEEFRSSLIQAEQYREVVLCGFGEPTLRLDLIKTLGQELKARSIPVRLNTNGHGNLIHRRNIVPELAGFLAAISISLDAHNEATYNRLCRPALGPGSYTSLLEFARDCIGLIPKVTLTVVEHELVDVPACRIIAANMGADFRVRRYYTHIKDTHRYLAPIPY